MASQGRRRAAFNLSASGNLVAAVTGSRIQLYGITLISSAVLTISISDGSGGTALFGPVTVQVGGGWEHPERDIPYLEFTSKSTALYLNITGTGNVGGVVSYTVE